MTKEAFWQEFIETTHQNKDVHYIEAFHFEVTEKLANELLELVLSGTKRATASCLWAYELEGSRMPQVGDYSIVTDWEGNPRCVIQTTAVTVVPFKEMTYEICKREGEDDTLASWQEGHKRFFIEEGKQLGYEFSQELPVLFEDFEVVFQK